MEPWVFFILFLKNPWDRGLIIFCRAEARWEVSEEQEVEICGRCRHRMATFVLFWFSWNQIRLSNGTTSAQRHQHDELSRGFYLWLRLFFDNPVGDWRSRMQTMKNRRSEAEERHKNLSLPGLFLTTAGHITMPDEWEPPILKKNLRIWRKQATSREFVTSPWRRHGLLKSSLKENDRLG